VASSEIIPFGKYRGQPLEVLRSDPGYVQWLTGQDWFRERFAAIHTVIVNNFAEPSETPAHNALQAKFLDEAFCRRLVIVLWQSQRAALPGLLAKEQHRLSMPLSASRRQEIEQSVAALEREIAMVPNFSVITTTTEFEVAGWDVRLDVQGAPGLYRLHVELKPALGDDYPAVLRQMRANLRHDYETAILIFDRFTASGATVGQIKTMFAASGFAVLALEEIGS
jgi:hypothetical protein